MLRQKRCDQCAHCRDYRDGGHLTCVVQRISHPCTYMRDAKSPCGPDGKLFKPRLDPTKEFLG